MARLSFDVVEAQHALQSPKKKRRINTGGSVVSSSDSSSTTTDENAFSIFQESSPGTGPLFSDDTYPMTEPRNRPTSHFTLEGTPTVRARRVTRKTVGSGLGDAFSLENTTTWKSSTTFCDSSPLQQRFHPDFRTAAGPNISFNSPPFPPASPSPVSEAELPVHSFQQRAGSPPRTPPPARRKTHTNTHTSEGAQLLMHLASSPTPAGKDSSSFPPQTPPRGLGNTPNGMLDASPSMFNFNTPGPTFNLAEFCNVTPSPAQAAFGGPRTPAMNKTPGGLSSTRRALDFDSLMPPSPSPARVKGLNLELGGKLVS